MGGSIADACLYHGWSLRQEPLEGKQWSAGRRVCLKTADAVLLLTAEPAAWTNLSLSQGS